MGLCVRGFGARSHRTEIKRKKKEGWSDVLKGIGAGQDRVGEEIKAKKQGRVKSSLIEPEEEWCSKFSGGSN